MAIVTLTTDYGTRDSYAGELKGVIMTLAPNALVVDVTHEVEPFNIRHGAFLLRQIWPFFPPGTIHLVVVDPGVGSERGILLGQYAGRIVIAPDNGLITFVHRDFHAESVRIVEERKYFLLPTSATFHGRDVMAPVAAHLVNGVKPREFGRLAEHIELLPIASRGEIDGNVIRGRVLYVDRYGTLVTNIRQEQLAAPRIHAQEWQVNVGGRRLGALRNAFHEVPIGEPLALIGGGGYLEIAINQGRAVERFGPPESLEIEVQ